MILRVQVLALLATLLLMAGCGSSEQGTSKEKLEQMVGGELKDVVPISGKVSVNGTATGSVNLHAYPAQGGGVPAYTTRTGEDGTYCWTTYELCDGLPPGEYRLGFTYVPKQGKGKDEGMDLLDGKYNDPSKSEFTLTVQAGQPQTDVNYDLTN